MSKLVKRIVSFFLVFVIMIFSAPMAFAAPEVVSTANWATWVKQNAPKFLTSLVLTFAPKNAVCPSPDSVDGFHRGHMTTGEVGSDGNYACTCDLCGKPFLVPESEVDLQQIYDNHVNDLPVPGLSSDGYLYWYPVFEYGSFCPSYGYSPQVYSYWGNTDKVDTFTPTAYSISFSLEGNCTHFIQQAASITSKGDQFSFYFSDVAPVDGYYSYPKGVKRAGYRINSSGVRVDDVPSDVEYSSSSSRSAGSSFSSSCVFKTAKSMGYSYIDWRFYYLPVKIQPLSGLIDPIGDTTYNIDSRPTSITGNYGIIGDNGQLIKVDNDTIVNETNKTVYNPVTNTTNNVTDWQYDYSTRTYTLTLDNGTTQTITYGDENITINEGDTVYNVYYVGDGPDPSTCEHTWSETSSTPATCTLPGSRLMTCSLCNETKTETIPAPGHTWQVKQTVNTQYDDTGQLTQQGYTIFECSVCHEQYKSEDGTSPPGGGSGGTGSGGSEGESLWDKLGQLLGIGVAGLLDLLSAVLNKVLDGLIRLLEGLIERLTVVVETVLSVFDAIPTMFSGFLDLLGLLFPFLPPEIVTILTFGIIAVVAIWIIKALKGR